MNYKELLDALNGAHNSVLRQCIRNKHPGISAEVANTIFFGLECAVEELAIKAELPEPRKAPETAQNSPQNTFKIGDKVSFIMGGGETVKALAVKETGDNTLFIFVDSLKNEDPLMNSAVDYPGWDDSDLRKKLNGEILDRFPEKVRKHMQPFENGDFLRIPTEKEIFGQNKYGMPEPDDIEQFPLMKLRRNRIAFRGYNGDWDYYWLQNRSVYSATNACIVNTNGSANNNSASYSYGVRPLFLLPKHLAPSGGEPTVTREWMIGGSGESAGTATQDASEDDRE